MSVGWAKPRAPLADIAFDGGRPSAESLGRGLTTASGFGSPGSAAENPAGLLVDIPNGLYTTAQVGTSSDAPDPSINALDPLQAKTIQYMAAFSQRGALFFEPLGRFDGIQILNAQTPTTDFREVDFAANAIGFAGAQKLGRHGAFGLSIAYLRGSLATTEHRTGQADTSSLDTGDGVRLNLGFRYPTGPAMWGLVFQNFPGFLWWKDHRRQLLPVRIRVGNTWRIREELLLSIEGEQRFYREGSRSEDFIYAGIETLPTKSVIFRGGVFADDIDKKETRHYTGGVTVKSPTGLRVSYAIERFKLNDQKVLKSFVSLILSFSSEIEDAK